MPVEWKPCPRCRAEWTSRAHCRKCAQYLSWHGPDAHRKGRGPGKRPRDLVALKQRELVRRRTAQLIATGVLVRPSVCSRCRGRVVVAKRHTHIDAHHPDYNNPKRVKWVCRRCHSFLHDADRKARRWGTA